MLNNFSKNNIIHHIIAYLPFEDKKSLSKTCKRFHQIIKGSHTTNEVSVRRLCLNDNLFELYLDNHVVLDCDMFEMICIKGYHELVNRSINTKGFDPRNLPYGLRGACFGSQQSVIRLIVSMMPKRFVKPNWNMGLYGACHGRRLDIVKSMILLMKETNVPIDPTLALAGACHGGRDDIARLVWGEIENQGGHVNVNEVMTWACCKDNYGIIKLAVNRGATNCAHCFNAVGDHPIDLD